MNISHWRNKH